MDLLLSWRARDAALSTSKLDPAAHHGKALDSISRTPRLTSRSGLTRRHLVLAGHGAQHPDKHVQRRRVAAVGRPSVADNQARPAPRGSVPVPVDVVERQVMAGRLGAGEVHAARLGQSNDCMQTRRDSLDGDVRHGGQPPHQGVAPRPVTEPAGADVAVVGMRPDQSRRA